ncbi:MAG: hypothetical protein H8E40_14205 [Chloroflexi bacterium]|nr:hypothetical protein [Chloroflexota bacterium]
MDLNLEKELMMVRVEQLVRQFDSLTAVNGKSFEGTQRELLGFLGRNGVGMTCPPKTSPGK